jgi:hypothetical protein
MLEHGRRHERDQQDLRRDRRDGHSSRGGGDPARHGQGPGARMPSGKFEIIVDAETPIDEWLTGLPS